MERTLCAVELVVVDDDVAGEVVRKVERGRERRQLFLRSPGYKNLVKSVTNPLL